jgi:hypothetical protein
MPANIFVKQTGLLPFILYSLPWKTLFKTCLLNKTPSMKPKHLLTLISFLLLNCFLIAAQEKKTDETNLKDQHWQTRERYEQQKKLAEENYKSEMEALKYRADLTPEQRKQQHKAIQYRFEEDKKANEEAYKKEMDGLKEDRISVKEERKDNKEKKNSQPVKSQKPVKPVKPVKSPKPMKH